MATILVFIVAGTAFGLGVGVIAGYLIGKNHGLRAAQRGFPVERPRV